MEDLQEGVPIILEERHERSSSTGVLLATDAKGDTNVAEYKEAATTEERLYLSLTSRSLRPSR